MATRGPKPTPTSVHIAEGTLRPNGRHAGRLKEPKASGVPEAPEWLDEEARRHWDAVVPDLIAQRVAKAIDTHALALLCDAWSRWRTLRESIRGDVGLEVKMAYTLSRLQKDWQAIGSCYGLTASDRTRLEIDEEIEEDEVAGMIA